MAETTTNMSLTVWNSLSDPYDSSQLVDNFVKLDTHNHATGKGVQIPNAGLVNSSVTVGSTAISLGSTATTLSGLTAVNATSFNGNATTATALATSRKINGTLFDGSNDIVTPLITTPGSLPTSTAVAGDEVYYQAATNVIWHLRFNGTRWDYLGGSFLRNDQEASVVTNAVTPTGSSTTYNSLSTLTTASITLPSFTGLCNYRIEIWGSFSLDSTSAARTCFMSYRTTAATASDSNSFSVSTAGTSTSGGSVLAAGTASPSTGFRQSVLSITGGTTLTAQFKQNTGGVSFYVNAHGISARPIFVS